MTDDQSPEIAIPTRAPAATTADDTVMPFEVAALDLRGRVVRLGPVVDEILERHAYPQPVAKLLGEAVVLTVMLGSALEDRRPLHPADADRRPGAHAGGGLHRARQGARLRAFRQRSRRRGDCAGKADAGALLGKGHLAMTIDQGADTSRYQGLVALEGGTLEDAAHEYFLRSEQIPTRVRLAVAEELRAGNGGASHRWRAGGIMLQFLPKSPERARVADLDPGDAPEGIEPHALPEDDAWVEGRALVETVEDVELIDPAVSSERLVYRLFHEPGVRVFHDTPMCARNARARATASRPCSRAFRRTTATTWSRTARFPSPANSAARITCSRRARSAPKRS